MNAPDAITIGNFNMVATNILKDVKDINTLLSANGNIMENMLKNSQDKIVNKIKNTFPKLQVALESKKELEFELKDMSNDPKNK
jgi:conjugal transfer/entry exclusion protein